MRDNTRALTVRVGPGQGTSIRYHYLDIGYVFYDMESAPSASNSPICRHGSRIFFLLERRAVGQSEEKAIVTHTKSQQL